MSSLVTILINNFNYGRFLAEAIDTALAQSYPNLEIIVVDDGSTDESRGVISRYGDRILPVLKDNAGQASAFNAGFLKSKGEWILLLDSDDLFLPHKVETLMSYAKEFPSAGLIAHNFSYCDEQGSATVFTSPRIESFGLVDDRARARRGKFTAFLPPTSTLALRRDIASKIFPVPEDITISADVFIKTVVLALTPVLLTPECLAIQRIHSANSFTRRIRTEESSLTECLVTARVVYRVKERFPFLSKIAWKAYGAVAYRLLASKAENAGSVRKIIHSEYDLLDRSLCSFYYVGGGFAMSFLREIIDARRAGSGRL